MMAETMSPQTRPALIVGLGGTGVSVLQHYKRRLLETRGSSGSPGYIRLLAMDADALPARAPQLDADEFVDLKAQISVVLHEISRGRALPGATRWLPNLEGYQHLGISGVAGVRPLGKVLFHRWREQRIRPAVTQAVAAITDRSRDAREFVDSGVDASVLRGIDIHVVFSLCGGMGAGTFIDAALYLRAWALEMLQIGAAPALIAHAVLPETFFKEQVRERLLEANTYAALAELDGFMEAQFPDGYLRAGDYPLGNPVPLFDECNLLSGMTDGDRTGADDVFRDIAECLRLRTVTAVQQKLGVGLTNQAIQARAGLYGPEHRLTAYSTYGVFALSADHSLGDAVGAQLFERYRGPEVVEPGQWNGWTLDSMALLNAAITCIRGLMGSPSAPNWSTVENQRLYGGTGTEEWREAVNHWARERLASFRRVVDDRPRTAVEDEVMSRLQEQAVPIRPLNVSRVFEWVANESEEIAVTLGASGQTVASLEFTAGGALDTYHQTVRDAASGTVPEKVEAVAQRFAADVSEALCQWAEMSIAARAAAIAIEARRAASLWREVHKELDTAYYTSAAGRQHSAGYGKSLVGDTARLGDELSRGVVRVARRALTVLPSETEPGDTRGSRLSELCQIESRDVVSRLEATDVHRTYEALDDSTRKALCDRLWSWARPRCALHIGYQATGQLAEVSCLGARRDRPTSQNIADGRRLEYLEDDWPDLVPLVRTLHGFPVTAIERMEAYRRAFLSVTATDRQEMHLFVDHDLALHWLLPGDTAADADCLALFSLSEPLGLLTRGDGYAWAHLAPADLVTTGARERSDMLAVYRARADLRQVVKAAWAGLTDEAQTKTIVAQISALKARIDQLQFEDVTGKQRGRRRELERGMRQLRSEVRALHLFGRDEGEPV